MTLAATRPGETALPARGTLLKIGAIAALAALGLALRLSFAAGPLWIDEIWSIENLGPIDHFWRIFWGLSHDNNHVLNSLWLYFALPLGDNSLWLRAPSLLAGTLAIPVMARLGKRQNAPAAVAGAALAALSFFFISYSAEARGYALGILAALVTFDALERGLDEPRSTARLQLACALGFGLFAHLAIAPAVVLFALFAFVEFVRRGHALKKSAAATFTLFWPTAIAALPALAAFAAGYIVMGGFVIGSSRPYSPTLAMAGQIQLALATFGAPTNVVASAAVAFLAPPAILAAIVLLAPRERRAAYCLFLVAAPVAVFLLHPRNSHIPRYYFLCAIFLVMLAADAFGALWRAGGARRWAAAVALGLLLASDLTAYFRFKQNQTPNWTDALTAIAASGQSRVATNFEFNVGRHIRYFNRRLATKLETVAPDRTCQNPPDFYILDTEHGAPVPQLTVTEGGCALRFSLLNVYGAPGLSQTAWGLYRRAPEAPSPAP